MPATMMTAAMLLTAEATSCTRALWMWSGISAALGLDEPTPRREAATPYRVS